ncbi:MAG TPA: maleylpyruvate isomerase family mycothiol-dependent enzyme [Acidimicrobiales bacterium]
MPTIVDKKATVDLLRDEFRQLAELGAALDDAQWDTPTCLPGWSVRDVLSHVIGSEAMLLGEPVPGVDISHLTHMRNPIAEANEVWVEAHRRLTGAEMMARLEDVATRRLAELDAMSQAEFDAPSWTPAGKDETYGRFMRIRHYDCYLHEQDIRLALGMPARQTVEDLASSLDEVATGLGFIVGRKAGMPDGSRVRIDLTGPAARTYLVQVDGRAAVVDALDGEPTVAIELPALHFLRLTGGRHDAGVDPEDGVRFSGDRELGGRLVANMAFTI